MLSLRLFLLKQLLSVQEEAIAVTKRRIETIEGVKVIGPDKKTVTSLGTQTDNLPFGGGEDDNDSRIDTSQKQAIEKEISGLEPCEKAQPTGIESIMPTVCPVPSHAPS